MCFVYFMERFFEEEKNRFQMVYSIHQVREIYTVSTGELQAILQIVVKH